ncbi:MAG: hypothetical protein J0H66_04685 [Solirubrobacterales bacterium]|nr:hypothetical protein [Solirubrobacterales bacterium]
MNRIKKYSGAFALLIAVLAVGGFGASTASAASITVKAEVSIDNGAPCTSGAFAVDDSGSTTINNALIGTIACPVGNVRIVGSDSFTATLDNSTGTGTLSPDGGSARIRATVLSIPVCTGTLTSSVPFTQTVSTPKQRWESTATFPADGFFTPGSPNACPTTSPSTVSLNLQEQ